MSGGVHGQSEFWSEDENCMVVELCSSVCSLRHRSLIHGLVAMSEMAEDALNYLVVSAFSHIGVKVGA